ncbi:MAG: HlyD family secretion protein [Vicinamibacterales bacterium]
MTAIDRIKGISRPWLLAAVAAFLLVAGYATWTVLAPRESTDDAQVSGHVSPVAPRVSGTVTAVKVTDNQAVQAGDVLVELDRRDYELALQHAQATLAAAEAAARAARAGVPITRASATGDLDVAEAGTASAEAALQAAVREVEASRAKVEAARARIAEAQAEATRASQDVARLEPLAKKDEIPAQQYDRAVATATAATAAVTSAEAATREAEANLAVAEARRAQADTGLSGARARASAAATAPQQIALTEARAASADADVQRARAAVAQAELDLERTVVRAPVAGIVSRRSVEPGQVVEAGRPILALTSLADVWVTANFKETQVGEMRPGQRVDIDVDAFGGHTFHGRVESIAAATGATFSLLPPDNASGNFVKVVQRIPVRIALDADASGPGDAVLRPGMSVNATVHLR